MNKVTDLALGLLFRFWVWLGNKLEVKPEVRYVQAPEKGPNRPNNNKKLTDREVLNIRELFRGSGLSQAAIAEIYDVNPATISRILRGIYHKGAA